MDAEYLGKEAERLAKDPVLIEAINRIRAAALDALVGADPNKATDVARMQAKVTVCDEFTSELHRMVREAAPVKPRPAIV